MSARPLFLGSSLGGRSGRTVSAAAKGASAAALEEGGSVIGLCVGTSSLWMMGFECWSASFQIGNRGRGSFSNSAAHCQRLRCRSCLRAINTPAASLAVFILTLGSSAACFSADVAAMQHANDPFHTRFVSAACSHAWRSVHMHVLIYFFFQIAIILPISLACTKNMKQKNYTY